MLSDVSEELVARNDYEEIPSGEMDGAHTGLLLNKHRNSWSSGHSSGHTPTCELTQVLKEKPFLINDNGVNEVASEGGSSEKSDVKTEDCSSSIEHRKEGDTDSDNGYANQGLTNHFQMLLPVG